MLKKLIIGSSFSVLAVMGFFAFSHSAHAATLFSWTSTGSNIVIDPAGGQNYTNGYGGGCASTCVITTSGIVDTITLKFKSETTRGNIFLTLLNDLGTEVDCNSAEEDTTGLADGALIVFEFTGTQCDVTANDIQGIKFNLGAGSSASNITWYGGADGSAVGKIYQVWDDGVGPVTDAIAFIAPPVNNATQVPFPQWTVQYKAQDPGASIKINVCPYLTNCPRYDVLPVSLAAATASTTKNVLLSAPLVNGTRYVAIAYLYHGTTTLATSSVDFQIASLPSYGTTTSTDQFASSTLNCPQYPWFEDVEFDFVVGSTTIPWLADTFADRGFCETKKFVGETATFLFVPGQINDSVGYVGESISGFKTVLPFSIYFTAIDAIEGSLEGSTTTDQTLGIIIPDMGADPDEYRHVTLISSTTITDALQQSQYCDASCAEETRDTYFGWLETIMYAGTLLVAVALIL